MKAGVRKRKLASEDNDKNKPKATSKRSRFMVWGLSPFQAMVTPGVPRGSIVECLPWCELGKGFGPNAKQKDRHVPKQFRKGRGAPPSTCSVAVRLAVQRPVPRDPSAQVLLRV